MGVYLHTDEWLPGENTVAYYPLTSTTTVNDMSGNGNTLTDAGVSFGTYGGINCVNCNRKSLYRNSISNLPTGNSARTISVWVYDLAYSSSWEAIYGYGEKTSGKLLVLFQLDTSNSNGTQVSFYGGDINVFTEFPLNSWHLMTFTYDGTTAKLYKDGELYGTSTISLNTTNSAFYISGWSTVNNEAFNGYLSNFIVENKAWTTEDVQNYYNSTKSNYGL